MTAVPGSRPPARRALAAAVVLLLTLAASVAAEAAPTVRVFAAASLADALDAAVERYESTRGVDVVPVYAASSTAARQIAHGAPADLYIAANRQWMDWLADRGIPLHARGDLLRNRLAVVASATSGIREYAPGADDRPLVALLHGDERLAVGDPAHVPAGIYARRALISLGMWDALAGRLARADNVRAALALVERGETPLGIVYRSDAHAADDVVRLGLFPADSHDPIAYPAALVGTSPNPAARAFREWLGGDEAMAMFADFGFTPARD
ncbi:molybdate transporter periplasmic protein [Salinisphaera sp. PC39]|uniref:molybdate ABC transporter substrate-binding protein n=1 Tax=Salinisphaera sp. PC39 TaxID=1304156 RepID=UPI00333F5331